MTEHFDYIVIGAGIEGSWAAYQIKKDGPQFSVLLLDKFHLPHSRGSSHGQSRITRHAYGEQFHTAIMPRAFRDWRQLEKDSKTNLLITKPLLCVADETGYALMDRALSNLRVEQAKGGNDISFQEMNCQELRIAFPEANFTENQRGFVEHSAGILYPDKCMAAVQGQFKALGGIIRDGFEVESVEPGQMVKVKGHYQGQKKELISPKVVMCPGPWAKKLIDPLLQNRELPLKAYRVPVYYWKVKENGRGVIKAIYKDQGSGDFWSIPELEYKNMVKFSSNLILYEIDPDNRDKNSTKEPIPAQLAEHIRNYFPGMEETPSIIETCIYTSTPDEISIIDTIPGSNNIAYACGFSGSGFKKAPCVGTMLKELLNPSEKKTYDMKPFSLERFYK